MRARLLLAAFLVWLVLAFSPARNQAADEEEETLYPSHHCDTGWYARGGGEDSITVVCYHSDQPN